ncbi:MAG: hydantoinase/oxoprolinase family protein [Alphaproteobacteria bacterium]
MNGGAIVGVDIGGTFTDLVVLEPSGGLRLAKVPTTPENRAAGVLAALEAGEVALDGAASLCHGTTATTNAIIERKIARIGLITTRGFRDVLELGRRTRPKPYGLIGSFEPLIPRELRFEVAERMAADGSIVMPLDEEETRDALARLRALGCEGVVIHFLHSYRNPAHELRAAEIAREAWPEAYVTAGHEVTSEFREYERGVAAAVNAAVQPILDRYVGRLEAGLAARGFARDLLIMQGNGGSIAARQVVRRAINTVMSGPASGVMAAAAIARAAGLPRIITYDMGGTSTDVGLVEAGVPSVSTELELEYAMPVHVPMVDVHSIGAGGGSIAWIDQAGLLRVGPESAGAAPGPIAYGKGGSLPTITDANLVLGRLDPARLLGVEAPPPREAIAQQLEAALGRRLGLDGMATAAAIVRIANDNMAGAIRMISLARGHDPRDFVLFAFGGAGPLHAAALARELGIPRLLVPARPGLNNALGCAIADLRHDFVATLNAPLSHLDDGEVRDTFARQVAAGREALARDGIALEAVEFRHAADMQFEGQTHILTVPVASAGAGVAALKRAFDIAYRERFEVELSGIGVTLVALKTAAIGRRAAPPLAQLAGDEAAVSLDAARIGSRPVWFDGGVRETPVYERTLLPWDAAFEGPALIVQFDGTVLIEPGNRVRRDPLGNLLVEIGP